MPAIGIVPKFSTSDFDNYLSEDSKQWHDDIEPIPRPVSQPSARSVTTPVVYDDHNPKYSSHHHHNHHSSNSHKRLDRSHSEPTSKSPANVNATRYKTELCRPYEENGECKYGDKCQFAHGLHELRSLSRHPKYKTELCKTFHTSGFCSYGHRCDFIHNEDETRTLQQRKKPGPFYLPPASGSLADSMSPPPSVGAVSPPPSTTANTAFSFAPLVKFTQPDSLSPPPSVSSMSPPPSATANTAFSFAPLVKFSPPDSPMDSYSSASSPSPVGSPDSRLPVFNRLCGPAVVSFPLRFSGELLAQ